MTGPTPVTHRTPDPTGYVPLSADLMQVHRRLTDQERQTLAGLRALLDEHVVPHADRWWEASEFPHELVPVFAEAGLFTYGYEQTRTFENSALFRGMVAVELARADASVGTFAGVHSGLAMGSVALCGSREQQDEWLPRMAAGEAIGCFALTEPEHGSDVARGLATTARRDGDEWILDGAKRWIGNGTWADIAVVWARDVADDQVKGFLVPKGTPGWTATKIEGKYSLRTVQNADITLDGVRVPERLRLQGANSFKDTARVLRLTRLEVAFAALGNAIGAYERAVAYALEREQFGREIGRFQLVQDLLSRCLAHLTSSMSVAVAAADLKQEGREQDHHASMAKMVVADQCRQVVAWCRELLGGNGVVIDHGVVRRFADAEAQYSFEGTREMNSLILGRHITGRQAFV
jgi:glutaryl-CoA dehydrogenase